MQQRLKRFVDERTYMLAAISHDLRTPLTRLRLFAQYVHDEQQRKLVLNDIGLGLTIARDVFHGHGGSITLASAAGGLRARVRLPKPAV